MHDIEPFYKWRDYYISEDDPQSPFFEKIHSEFEFTDAIYNYVIHPQWDDCGSPTLFLKIVFVDYDRQYAFIELLGEWNDTVQNDIMLLKRNIVDVLIEAEINKFVFFCGNLLNFHAGDEDYYEEWHEDICESDGWITFLDTFDHVQNEMGDLLAQYINYGPHFNGIPWREMDPALTFRLVSDKIATFQKLLH